MLLWKMMMMGHSLAPSRLKMRDLLAAFASFLRLVEELPRRGVSLQWKVGKARLSISFCWQKKWGVNQWLKCYSAIFRPISFCAYSIYAFVFKGLKSYYIWPKTLLCSYFNVVMVLYAIYYLFIQVYEVLIW